MRSPTAQMEEPSSGRSSVGITKLVFLGVSAVLVVYLAVRFTRDRPVDYADDLLHFKHGSTGGERRTGIPYWLFVAFPELFPEYLPDKTPGRGYSSFGMIYENQDDPRYRPAGRHVDAQRARPRRGVPELRGVPYRDRTGRARRYAACRRRNAREYVRSGSLSEPSSPPSLSIRSSRRTGCSTRFA